MSFTTGDTVVHPRHGVATVQGMTSRGRGKDKLEYLELFIDAKSMTIMVPVDSLEEVGIRRVATPDEAEVILGILEETSDVPEVWAERNAATLSRIQSTELVQASMVIRDLTRHSQRAGKPLSAAENASLMTCLETVSMELSLSLGKTQDETRELIMDKVGVLPTDAPADAG